jgi:dipeptidyl aminopeptidase/acylaminoacyl peptidase
MTEPNRKGTNKMLFRFTLMISVLFAQVAFASPDKPKIVDFPSGTLTLQGELFIPDGDGPFPAVLYNHGSAPGMLNSQASAVIGPMFAKRGWVFFMPYRRGQGLSEDQGPYIMDKINSAKWSPFKSSSQTMVHLLESDHLNDQISGFEWLKKQKFVQSNCIAAMGNSFGGIETILGMAHADYFAGIDASGGAQSWKHSDELQLVMKKAVSKIKNPVFFFQAANDYDLSPSKVLSSEMLRAGKVAKFKIYPEFGNSKKDGHSFPYRGASIWFEDVFSFLNNYCPLEQQ